MSSEAAGIIIFIGVTGLAWWQKDLIVWLLAALITVFTAAAWMADLPGISLSLWFLGGYELYQAVITALQAGGAASGWSRFKHVWNKIRGRNE